MSPFDQAFITNYMRKGDKNLVAMKSEPLIRDASELLALQLGEQNYITVSGFSRLNCRRDTQMKLAPNRLQYGPGTNKEALCEVAPRRFRLDLLVNMGDGTRGRRELCRSPVPSLIGTTYPPDVSKWPTEPAIPMPTSVDDVRVVIDACHDQNALAHEFDTEALRCISDPTKGILVHTIFPEPHKGFSTFFHVKMWVHFISMFAQASLLVCGFATDCCSTGLGAAKMWGRPSAEFIALGIVYLGSLAQDYDYYGVYCRPPIKLAEAPEQFQPIQQFCTPVATSLGLYIPPAFLLYLDIAHHVRTFRRNVLNANTTIVFFSEKDPASGAEVIKCASMLFLKRLASDRRFKGKYNLADMVTFNSFMDQRGDAAYDLISVKTISLLEREHRKEDPATILAMKSMYYLTLPFKNKKVTNPFAAVQHAWLGLAVWELQEQYIAKHIKNVDLHCPSPQFRTANKVLACAVFNHCLNHFRHKEQTGRLQEWHDLNLFACNTDELENLHSEERGGGVMRTNKDSSVNLSEHCHVMSRLQEIAERKPRLREAGFKVGAPRNARKSQSGLTNLGLWPGVQERDLWYGPHSPIKVPAEYDYFLELLEEARTEGYRLGCEMFREHLPDTYTQMVEKQTWMSCCADRPKTKPPVGANTDWLSTASLESSAVAKIKKCIDPEELTVPKKLAAELKKLDNQIAAEKLADPDAVGDGDYRTPEVVKVIETSTMRRAELRDEANKEQCLLAEKKLNKGSSKQTKRHWNNVHIKQEFKVMVMNEKGGTSDFKKLLSGDYLLDSDGVFQKSSQVLRVCQLRDRHSHDRDKRFWVGRLRSFRGAIKDGHDATIGSCLLVKWGGATQAKWNFAVVRVLGIIDGEDENKAVWSIKLNVQSALQRFQVELLDPAGPPTESNSQKYRGSGLVLPKLAAKLVVKQVELMHLHALADPGVQTHDALLSIESVLDLYEQGHRRVTMQEGRLHIENEAEKLQNLDAGVMWDANVNEVPCYHCSSSFYDAATGVILCCKRCKIHYHQECHTPKVKLDSLDNIKEWECAVCTGEDADICAHCNKPYTVDHCKREKDNNRLMYCEGHCGKLWHQKCYKPYIVYPGDDVPWICERCVLANEKAAAEEEEAAAVSGKPKPGQTRSGRKTAKPGSNNLNQVNVDGQPVKNLKLADPPQSKQQKATWEVTGAVHAKDQGKHEKKKGRKGKKKA